MEGLLWGKKKKNQFFSFCFVFLYEGKKGYFFPWKRLSSSLFLVHLSCNIKVWGTLYVFHTENN